MGAPGWNMAPQLFVLLYGAVVQAEGKAVHFETLRTTTIAFEVLVLFSICLKCMLVVQCFILF